MSKHKKKYFVTEFCEMNNLKPNKLYGVLRRHPELARSLKINLRGQRKIDEESAKSVLAFLRKDKLEKGGGDRKKCISGIADEINILAAQVDDLRKEVKNLKIENERLKKYICLEKQDGRKNKAIASAVLKTLGRDYLPGDEKRLAEYLSSCADFKIFMDSKIKKAEECFLKNEDR